MGGGEYDRTGTLETPGEDQLTRVSADPNDQPDIAGALTERGGQGVIELIGSRRFAAPSAIEVAADHTLELRAADTTRPLVDVGGELLLVGGDSGEITLNGLLIAGGRLRVPATFNGRPNLLQRVRLVHCTLVPGQVLNRDGSSQALGESLVVECANTAVELDHCIAGALRVVEEASLTIGDSIVDALDEAGVAYAALDGAAPAGPLCVDASTIIGRVRTLELEASNTIFHASPASSGQWQAPVIADHRQAGYVRYSYIAPEAQAPHRYACQPGSAPACRGTIAPRFTSLRYGDPGYCQLHASCPPEISRGADDEAEMGAFHELYWPQREAGLQTRLDEYLRFGLEAGLFYAS
jgi:hypothetical protein